MQVKPFLMFHGDQLLRRASSSSSIRQLVSLVDEIDEKNNFLKTLFLSFISCFIAVKSEELCEVCQFVNSSF